MHVYVCMYGSPCAQLTKLLPLTDFIDRVSVFLPTTAETLCTNDCATICWEEIPTTCGAHSSRPPVGKQFKAKKPRPVGGWNSYSVRTCPGSLVPVNEEECRELGARPSFTFGYVMEVPQFAPGCFTHGQVFFYNTHPIGMQGGEGPLWCKQVATNCTYLPYHCIFVFRTVVVGFRQGRAVTGTGGHT
jgi:hypothetical protein